MKKYIVLVILFSFLGSLNMSAQRKKDDQQNQNPVVIDKTPSASQVVSEDKLVNQENLDFFVSPTNHKNIFVKLSQPLVAKRYETEKSSYDFYTNDDGQVVKQKKSDITIGSDVKGQILEWQTYGLSGWMGDLVGVSFNLGDEGGFVEIWFRFIQKDSEMIAVLNVPNEDKRNEKFILKIKDGSFIFGPESYNTILLYEEVVLDPGDPLEAKDMKPGEMRRGKIPGKENQWSNYGITIGDL